MMSTFANKNEMSPKIQIAFRTLSMTAYPLTVLEFCLPHFACTEDVWVNTDTQSWFVLQEHEHTHPSPNHTIKRWPNLNIPFFESISDKVMRYNLNLITCTIITKITCSYFLPHNSVLYYFQQTFIFLLFRLMHSLNAQIKAACFV